MTKLLMRVLILSVFIISASSQEHHIVNTTSGPVKGLLTQHDMGVLYTFFKIPFAKPPVGQLRFKKPEPVEPWNDVIDGTQQMPSCSQPMGLVDDFLPNTDVSEDCLFLNVYVPNNLSSASNKSVMVWIYGGGYTYGQGNMFDASELALTGDVIVVIINYRVNVFGFMTTWDSTALGNYGLWDQIMALRWVKNNIETFGGNPDSITIFGQSAGGFSVSILSFLPQNKGLFHRVIAQSGTANSPIAFNNDEKSYMKTLFEKVKCDKSDSASIIECLRKVPSENFSNITLNLFSVSMNDFFISMAPKVDNDLVQQPLDLTSDLGASLEFFRSLDYMTGFNNAEGVSMVTQEAVMDLQQSFDISEGISPDALCNRFMPRIAKRSFESIPEVSKALCNVYRADDKVQQAKNAVDLCGDFLFAYPAIQSLVVHSKQNKATNTYQYILTRPVRSVMREELPKWFEGAPHGKDLVYLFDFKDHVLEVLTNSTFTEADRNLKQTMIKYWTNFAKTGNPNSESLPNWPSFSEYKMEYMNLNLVSKSEAADSNMNRRIKLWSEVIPEIVERHRKQTVNRVTTTSAATTTIIICIILIIILT